jgi:hypothetical protein
MIVRKQLGLSLDIFRYDNSWASTWTSSGIATAGPQPGHLQVNQQLGLSLDIFR